MMPFADVVATIPAPGAQYAIVETTVADMPTPLAFDAVTPTPDADAPPTITPTSTIPQPLANLPPLHYWLERPIPLAFQDYLDRTYPYGGTSGGRYRPHTGGDFFNPAGTPVVAVANATVAYAGTDQEIVYGPSSNFYGNLIVLQLTGITYKGQSIYALYGHLSQIDVETGQNVAAGSVIGEVGGTGVANGGPHLHFEVRIGDPKGYFTSTRNPDLWIEPYRGYGTLAGLITDGGGIPLREISIVIYGDDVTRYTWTYSGNENHPDDEWGENFTYGDLPEGWYTVSARSEKRTYSEDVYIWAGRTSWLEWEFD